MGEWSLSAANVAPLSHEREELRASSPFRWTWCELAERTLAPRDPAQEELAVFTIHMLTVPGEEARDQPRATVRVMLGGMTVVEVCRAPRAVAGDHFNVLSTMVLAANVALQCALEARS